MGYKVIGDNHLGDWGTQFGIMISAYKKYKSEIPNLKGYYC
ncbi:arginine--tRNA ligase [Patescibacteria group bacterium]|nr:arginine--tRNA ligase [Patescibacteria group bacterium]